MKLCICSFKLHSLKKDYTTARHIKSRGINHHTAKKQFLPKHILCKKKIHFLFYDSILKKRQGYSLMQTCHSIEMKNLDLTNKKLGSGGKIRDHGPIGSLSLLISLSLGETLLLEPFDRKVYDLLPVQ